MQSGPQQCEVFSFRIEEGYGGVGVNNAKRVKCSEKKSEFRDKIGVLDNFRAYKSIQEQF